MLIFDEDMPLIAPFFMQRLFDVFSVTPYNDLQIGIQCSVDFLVCFDVF